MRLLKNSVLLLLGSLVIGAFLPVRAQTKPVMVHYMPWFQSPYSLGGTNWGNHWKMNYFNPNVLNNSYREIASWYYPLIGPYDSIDPAALEYHVLLMKLAGIDGVIVDWYGQDNYYDYAINNARTLALLNFIQKAGLKFALCYEDATIAAEISDGTKNGITVTTNNAVAHAQQTMLYAQSNYFASPNYLRLNGQPVLLNFGPQYFTQSTQWASIFSVLDATNQPAFFTEDNRLSPVGQGAFDWPPMWTSATNNGVVTDAMMQRYLSAFEQKALAWPAFISSAFPRFHDIYAQAGGTSFGYLDDQNGNTLQETLSRAMTNASAIVQIVTWNDFGEGTVVEPTVARVSGCALVDTHEPTTEYGYTDLGIIQDFRREYLDTDFPYHTNDLALALRLFNLRELYGNSNPVISAELDRVFSNIISGNLTLAKLQLTGIETGVPVIYDLSLTNRHLQFSIGGFLSGNGLQIETSSNLATWQTISNMPASTNPPDFRIVASPGITPSFFRVQNN